MCYLNIYIYIYSSVVCSDTELTNSDCMCVPTAASPQRVPPFQRSTVIRSHLSALVMASGMDNSQRVSQVVAAPAAVASEPSAVYAQAAATEVGAGGSSAAAQTPVRRWQRP